MTKLLILAPFCVLFSCSSDSHYWQLRRELYEAELRIQASEVELASYENAIIIKQHEMNEYITAIA